ncbi:MAG: dynamin family protein [Muribaculaceae bacterium]|nr:dynamin family protein [Muribaculaceae bacterium]
MDAVEFKNFIDNTSHKIKSLEKIDLYDFKKPIESLRESYNDFMRGGEELIKEGDILKIGVVGQVKAGKSSFLNSLFFDGESILPKASTPMTAGLTVLEYSDSNEFEIEYYNQQEWEEFKKKADAYKAKEADVRNNPDNAGAPESLIQKEVKSKTDVAEQSAHELVSKCGRIAQSKIGEPAEKVSFKDNSELQKTLNTYVGADGELTSVVKMLTLKMHDPRLKGVRIVDTPGVNDPIVSRENRTKEFLHSCHGVFFLSYSSRFFDSVDMSFMNTRIGNQGVGTVLMLASKYDDVLQDQGIKYRDDIEEADNKSRESLERRFRAQKAEILHQNVDMRFDTTSGISYALATKNRNTWDEMEKHVDKRMHELFPSAFSSEEDSKDTYLLLANLEQIREDYLDKMFIANKEKIIQAKISEYFKNNLSDLAEQINELAQETGDKKKQLESTDIKKIYEQEKKQNELFESLKGDFTVFLSGFQNSLQTSRDTLSEMIQEPQFFSLPMEDSEVRVTYKGWLWGHNTDTFWCKAIDTYSLKEQIQRAVTDYCNQWSQLWAEHFKKGRDKMFDSFCESITNFSSNINDVNFSDRYYRQLMTQLLSDIERHGVIKLQDIKNKYLSELSTFCDNQTMKLSSKSYECEEEEVQGRLNRDAQELVAPLPRMLNNKLESFVKQVKNAVEDCIKPTNKALSELKGSVGERLKTAGKDYLDNLKAQIAEKEKTLAELNTLSDSLTSLQDVIKA